MEKAGGTPSAISNQKIKNPSKNFTNKKLPEGVDKKRVGKKAPHKDLFTLTQNKRMKVPTEDGRSTYINASAGIALDPSGNVVPSPDVQSSVKTKKGKKQPLPKQDKIG